MLRLISGSIKELVSTCLDMGQSIFTKGRNKREIAKKKKIRIRKEFRGLNLNLFKNKLMLEIIL